MKKFTKTIFTVFLATTLILSLAACGKTETPNSDAANTEAELWKNATYNTDTELGQGSKNLLVVVKAYDQSVLFTIHTDETTVGGALLENNLITGDDSAYGLYVKSVNGIVADYDADQSYWAFYIDDDYAVSGVDQTEIAEESVYKLEYTK